MYCDRDSVVHTTTVLAEQNNQLNTGCEEDPPQSEYESSNSIDENQPAGNILPHNTTVGTFNHPINGFDNLEEDEAELQGSYSRTFPQFVF